ncbi:conserved hypothetical protein [Theileria equi strain WA]|uniref:Serine aminopeptidase S33 domain-containing protein n=1 Tax=Theileria equi strain WA TaxID=1537102 RepID=L1LCZ3_THEEQ|nr:conserved hypothetical protein [Theileria equi strain WA]EKX73287.1 conserved hypothetical protein [Theileria equi strain WA]|eukprot:XP_004832739.1 conserved hypothetical protein [Theileria equi strain WA]
MRCTLFLYILLLFARHSPARQWEPGEETEDVILDVTTPDSSSIDAVVRSPYGITTYLYAVKPGHRVSAVKHGEDNLWTRTDDCSFEHAVATLYEKGTPSFILVCFKGRYAEKRWSYYGKNDNEWKKTTEEEFYKSFNRRVITSITLDSVSLRINGSNDPKRFYANTSPRFPFLAYIPNVGYRIHEVIYTKYPGSAGGNSGDVSSVVWKANSEDERCLHAYFYPKSGPKLGHLLIQDSNGTSKLFYKRREHEWILSSEDEYRRCLVHAGFNASEFDDSVTADIRNVDSNLFYIKNFTIAGHMAYLFAPFVGFKLKYITDDGVTIWNATNDLEHCTHVNLIYQAELLLSCYILVNDPKNGRKVLYFVKKDKEWKEVHKDEYYDYLVDRNENIHTHKGDGKVIMSSFKNRQGIKIVTYASRVENAKGDIILSHGIRSHFKSEFCASSTDWNYRHFGSPVSPGLSAYFVDDQRHADILVSSYKHLFENVRWEGMNVFEVTPRYDYRHSFVEALNRMGYNVYGLDLQSHGLSESQTEKRCYVSDFKDYVYDVLQFVSIVKRGKFSDSSEKWDEDILYNSVPTDRKVLLLGNSMGGNLIIQAVQEFHRNAEKGAKLIDGLIVTSGMFNLDHYFRGYNKTMVYHILGALAWKSPEKDNNYEDFLNYGEFFELFIRHKDPFFQTKRLVFKTTFSLLSACDDVKKSENMVSYPRDLPTLLFHTVDDTVCSIKGSRDVLESLDGDANAKLVELSGSLHYITAAQPLFLIKPHIKEWLEQYT